MLVALQERPGALEVRIAGEQVVERRGVVRLEQMGELVQDHVVGDPQRHRAQAIGQPDAAVRRGARPPAPVLVAHPADGERGQRDLRARREVGAKEVTRAPGEGLVLLGEAPPGLPAQELLDQWRHQVALLGGAEPGRDEGHQASAFPEHGERAPAPGTAPDLHLGLRHGRHVTTRRGQFQLTDGEAAHYVLSARPPVAGPLAGEGKRNRGRGLSHAGPRTLPSAVNGA